MLALFPLQNVLFPDGLLDLQVFEPRYLDMVSRVMRGEQGFGVVPILEGQEVGAAPSLLGEVGCEASIVDWQQLPNGLLGIRVRGGRRFRLGETQRQRDGLLLAPVDWLEEEADLPLDESCEELVALLRLLGAHPLVRDRYEALPSGQRGLGERLSELLPLPIEQKAGLLAMSSPSGRLELIRQWLEHWQD